MDSIRTRFAPSPTGYLHVGGVRTALFSFLLARHKSGVFILRFEDTDKNREVVGAKEHILKCLKVLNLHYDEGPNNEGSFGPYEQSKRLSIYTKWAEKLIAENRAYPDLNTPEQLDNLRKMAIKNKKPFLFRDHRPQTFTSWDKKTALRFKSEPKDYKWSDLVMGDLSTPSSSIDDFILIKSDGYPTYNFANVIDDHEMKVTHVLRGQEYLSSLPNYLNLHEALNIKPPNFATLPHVLNEAGNKKLSKRDGAKDILEYIDLGYLPESLLSFIATLGWNDGTTQEIFTLKELISKFDIKRVQRSGAKFDEKRLNFINGNFIRKIPLEDLFKLSKNYWPKESNSYDDNYKMKVLALLQERLKYLAEIKELSLLFFKDLKVKPELISNNTTLNNLSNVQLINLLEISSQELKQIEFREEIITNKLNELLKITNQKPAVLFSLIRIATTQTQTSPPLAPSLSVLGKDRSLNRMSQQIEYLKNNH